MDITKPSLEALAFLLRHKYLWPRKFIWDYSDFSTGPIGLARAQWFGSDPTNLEAREVVNHWAVLLHTDYETIRWLFLYDLCYWYAILGLPVFFRPRSKITPEMVAREIERLLRKKNPAVKQPSLHPRIDAWVRRIRPEYHVSGRDGRAG